MKKKRKQRPHDREERADFVILTLRANSVKIQAIIPILVKAFKVLHSEQIKTDMLVRQKV